MAAVCLHQKNSSTHRLREVDGLMDRTERASLFIYISEPPSWLSGKSTGQPINRELKTLKTHLEYKRES